MSETVRDLKTVRITLTKSPIGYNKKQKATLQALGLKRLNDSREIKYTVNIQGMVNKVSHLVTVEEIEG